MARNICKDKNEFIKAVEDFISNDKGLKQHDGDNIGNLYREAINAKKDKDTKLMEFLGGNLYYCSKSSFNLNINFDMNSMAWEDYASYKKKKRYKSSIYEFKTLDSGEIIYGYDVFDFENSTDVLTVIAYVEDGKLKWYVPERGNTFRADTLTAYCTCDKDRDTMPISNEKEQIEDVIDYFHNRQEGEHSKNIGNDNFYKPYDKPLTYVTTSNGRRICNDVEGFRRNIYEVLRKQTEENRRRFRSTFPTYEDFIDSEEFDEYASEIVKMYECDSEMNVDVDFENVDMGGKYVQGSCIKGIETLSNGAVVYGFDCGGDWEEPVNAIIYIEDDTFKIYVPEKGNTFNTDYMCAHGSERNYTDEYDDKRNEWNLKCDRDLEIADIEDFFNNRQIGEHAAGLPTKKS